MDVFAADQHEDAPLGFAGLRGGARRSHGTGLPTSARALPGHAQL